MGILLPEGVEVLSNGPLNDWIKNDKLCDLCGSACPMKFMSMRSEANFIGAVNKF